MALQALFDDGGLASGRLQASKANAEWRAPFAQTLHTPKIAGEIYLPVEGHIIPIVSIVVSLLDLTSFTFRISKVAVTQKTNSETIVRFSYIFS